MTSILQNENDFNAYKHYTVEALVDLWYNFIKFYYREARHTEAKDSYYITKIREMIHGNILTFVMDYEDIVNATTNQFDKLSDIGEFRKFNALRPLILRDPELAHTSLEMAVIRFAGEMDDEFVMTNKEMIHAAFTNIPIKIEISDLNHEYIGRMVQIEGLISEMDNTKSIARQNTVFVCANGHVTRTLKGRDPRKCSGQSEDGTVDIACTEKDFREDDRLSEKDDFIQLKVQQRPDRIMENKTIVDVDIDFIGRDMSDRVQNDLQVGDLVNVTGIIKLKQGVSTKTSGITRAAYYIKGSYIERRPESELVESDETYKELVTMAVRPETEEADYRKLVHSIAPSLWSRENDIIKEVLLLLLIGSDRRIKSDGTYIRGDLNVCLIGDSSLAKSAYAEFLRDKRSRTIYTSGSRTSAVGLVGGLIVNSDKTVKLSAGAYGMAGNGGMVIIDEFEKRPRAELEALAEPLSDQQTLTVMKGDQRLHRRINCATLAIGNPKTDNSKYDVTKDVYENTQLPNWLLSRFDLLYVMRDVAEEHDDLAKFNHVMKSMEQAATVEQFQNRREQFTRLDGEYWPPGFIKHWVSYVRDKFHPRAAESSDAKLVFKDFFMKFRKLNKRIPKNEEERLQWTKDFEIPAVDLRALNALVRISEALARAHHRNVVLKSDASHAVEIYTTSLASSGFMKYATISGTSRPVSADDVELEVVNRLQKYESTLKARSANQDFKIFNDELERASWQNCTQCKGKGVWFDDEQKFTCDWCNGEAGNRVPFNKETFMDRCRYRGVGPGAFQRLWKTYIDKGEIISGQYGYENTRPHITHWLKPTMEESNMREKSPDDVFRENIMRNSPGIMKELESLEDGI